MSDDLNRQVISGFTLINDQLLTKNGLARASFLIHNKINFKTRPDLTSQVEELVAGDKIK